MTVLNLFCKTALGSVRPWGCGLQTSRVGAYQSWHRLTLIRIIRNTRGDTALRLVAGQTWGGGRSVGRRGWGAAGAADAVWLLRTAPRSPHCGCVRRRHRKHTQHTPDAPTPAQGAKYIYTAKLLRAFFAWRGFSKLLWPLRHVYCAVKYVFQFRFVGQINFSQNDFSFKIQRSSREFIIFRDLSKGRNYWSI